MADPHRPSRNLPVSLVARDPVEARRRAELLLRKPVDPRTRARVLRVGGLAAYELGRVAEAREQLDSAVAVASGAGLSDEAAMARASRLGISARHGEECGTLPPSPFRVSAFTLLGRGVAACQIGRFTDALAAFAAAEPAFRSSADPRLLPGLLCSQGLALVHAERFDEAEEVLRHGLASAEKYSLRRLRAAIVQNLGCLAAARGDTALAMERFDAAAPLLGSGTRQPALVLDRAHALADAGMLREAGALRRSLGPVHGGADRALTELLTLKLAVGRGSAGEAGAAVRRLRRLFPADSSWLRVAEQISRPSGGTPRPAPPRPSGRTLPRVATPHLELAAHADLPGTVRTLRDAAAALRAGNASAALLWSERSRALTTDPHTCQDRKWAALLNRYRRAHLAFAESGSAESHRELALLEVELAVGQWHPCCRRRPSAPPDTGRKLLDRLAFGLGSRALVHYPEPDGLPAAITLVDGRARLHELPDARTVGDAVAAFEHLARLHAVTPRPRTARLLAERAAAVDRLLVAPVAAAVGDRDLVVVPGPNTQTLPWGLLPGLRGRPVSVAPSGRAWLRCRERARRTPRTHPRVLLAAGPGLAAAETEIAAVARRHRGARTVTGAAACSRTVLRHLARADLAHISAHGFDSDGGPMCSGLWLADGPLFAYDVERVRRLPALVVLSSCETGRSTPTASGRPLGMAASLLARGSATVLASVLPVPDGATAAAMTRAHDALLAGASPAAVVADHLAATGFVCFGAG